MSAIHLIRQSSRQSFRQSYLEVSGTEGTSTGPETKWEIKWETKLLSSSDQPVAGPGISRLRGRIDGLEVERRGKFPAGFGGELAGLLADVIDAIEIRGASLRSVCRVDAFEMAK